ncbi:MAG: hypothetical protein QOJ50_396 [Cryptosporangiaceae bacterium]|nr:hypothetical protein [Cryptosporangiaceae bacterium]
MLDIDVVRGMLGGWLADPGQAGLMARRMAIEMARVQLLGARDVIVPQFLGQLPFVLDLERLCGEVAAEFVEVALVGDPDEAAARFARRSADPQTPEHRDAAALQERIGGPAALPTQYERLLTVIAARPATRTITVADGEIDEAYAALLAAVAGPASRAE